MLKSVKIGWDDRRRKVTDKSLPQAVSRAPEFEVDSKMYKDIQETKDFPDITKHLE